MNKVICTTTINLPSEALRHFAAMRDWTLVVAGDLKTPLAKWPDSCIYLSPIQQDKFDIELSGAIGWNCIQRRNMAFLYAAKELKADVIASVDDDNIPLQGWGEKLLLNSPQMGAFYSRDQEVFDPISATLYKNLWHRGFPLELLRERSWGAATVEEHPGADIQADFWNGDADVDAVCRMEHGADNCEFDSIFFPMWSDRPSPFNSQNTFLSRSVLPNYFMHLDVGRYDDILAAYHVQALGHRVIYGKPSVRQRRNNHDLMDDFKKETWGYQNILGVIRALFKNPKSIYDILSPRAAKAFQIYQSRFE